MGKMTETCVYLENGNERLDLVGENVSEIKIFVNLPIVENGNGMWTWVDLVMGNVGRNRGQECAVEPCSVFEPRPLFGQLVLLPQTVKKTKQ